MIKINLKVSGIGSVSGISGSEVNISMGSEEVEIQKQGFFRLLIILLGPLALYLWQIQNIPGIQTQLRNKQTVLEELVNKNESAKSAVEEIKKYKTDELKLKEQINTIENLRKDRMREVRILDLIQREMPEKMWLTRIEMRENKINITGFAATDSELTQFMDILSKSVFMQDVSLVRTTEKNIEGSTLKDFSIGATLKKIEIKDNRGAG